jgi:hypothetical protein
MKKIIKLIRNNCIISGYNNNELKSTKREELQ